MTAIRWGHQAATALAASPTTSAAGVFHTAVEAQKHSKSFLRCLEVLDVGKVGTISQSKAEEALQKYVKFFQESDQKLQEALVQLVVESGQLYLAGMHLLEQRAFFLKVSGWGKKLRRGDVPKELAAWSQDSGNKEKLVKVSQSSITLSARRWLPRAVAKTRLLFLQVHCQLNGQIHCQLNVNY